MDRSVVACPACGAKNRLGSGDPQSRPRCGRCQAALPWLVAADEASFAAEIGVALPVLVDFWAEWCGPCHAIAPVLEQVAAERAEKLKVVKVDVDANRGLQARYRVSGIPTLILLHGGKVLERFSGAMPKAALLARLDPHLQ